MKDFEYFVGTMNGRSILCVKENKELTKVSRPLTRIELQELVKKLNEPKS